jgi:predicted component of type VI protein secretion system
MSNAKDFYLDVPAGADVFQEGDAGSESYIIESGQIELTHGGDVAFTLNAGDFFGEAAIDGKPHATGARASAKSRLLRIERGAIGDVIKQNPEIALRILKQVVGRQVRLVAAAPAKEAPKPEVAKPKAPEPAPAPVPAPAPPPAAPIQSRSLALRAAGSDQPIVLDASLSDFLIGRPDPASGINPEVDLGPFNANGTLSRRHARIGREGSLYFLREETGVANGTFVNGERLQAGQKVPIKPGDKLRFGLIDVDVVSV